MLDGQRGEGGAWTGEAWVCGRRGTDVCGGTFGLEGRGPDPHSRSWGDDRTKLGGTAGRSSWPVQTLPTLQGTWSHVTFRTVFIPYHRQTWTLRHGALSLGPLT